MVQQKLYGRGQKSNRSSTETAWRDDMLLRQPGSSSQCRDGSGAAQRRGAGKKGKKRAAQKEMAGGIFKLRDFKVPSEGK